MFFYFRMIRYRIRLYRDLRDIKAASNKIIPKALELAKKQPEDYGVADKEQ
jgi:lipopolysaccharide export system permease protein